jgi:hypothetical protein
MWPAGGFWRPESLQLEPNRPGTGAFVQKPKVGCIAGRAPLAAKSCDIVVLPDVERDAKKWEPVFRFNPAQDIRIDHVL